MDALSTPLGRKMAIRALERGWDSPAYYRAVAINDENGVTLNHPTNYLTEEETERLTCSFCLAHDGEGPPHSASSRCESGKHNHCSCDVCF